MGKRLLLCTGVLLLAAGCGPVQSMTVIWEANAAIEGAKAAEAQNHAPYEYYSAEAYLEKALEEQSYADFEPAIEFGTKAVHMARKAKEKADRATQKVKPPTLPSDETPVENVGDMPAVDEPTPAPVKVVPVPEAQPEPAPTEDSAPIVVPIPE